MFFDQSAFGFRRSPLHVPARASDSPYYPGSSGLDKARCSASLSTVSYFNLSGRSGLARNFTPNTIASAPPFARSSALRAHGHPGEGQSRDPLGRVTQWNDRCLGHLDTCRPTTRPTAEGQMADQPLSTGRMAPLMLLASSEARNTIASACSSGSATRPVLDI
jgi:hypothetical protein